MKLLVVGSLRDVPGHPELCGSFVTKLAEQIVERGHTLLNGCRGSLDKAIAEAADARLKALGRPPESQLVGYHFSEADPVHRFGVIRISERKDWDLTHPQLTPPEQIAEADAAIFVAGNEGTFIAANWARIAGIPVLGVAEFGGAGKALYAHERSNLAKKFGAIRNAGRVCRPQSGHDRHGETCFRCRGSCRADRYPALGLPRPSILSALC